MPVDTRSSSSPAPSLSIDALVDATPDSRDRVVDLLRAVSICVVVAWHWTFSILHWHDGALTMPNPVGDVPGLWTATWLLQVMPLFFLVGGYANLAGWEATVRRGGGARQFLAKRFARLLRPVAVYVVAWTVLDLAWRAGGGRSVLDWGSVVFVPLWFLGVYAGVVALVPVTARLHGTGRDGAHRRGAVGTLAALGLGVAAADVARLGFDLDAGGVTGLAGSAFVWVLCHQLGYWWQDGSLVSGGRRVAVAVTAAGLAALALLTGLGPYSRSMVAIRGEDTSNMFPTTACIAALAVLQLGVVLLVRDRLDAWLRRRRPAWRAVVAANGVAMTVFCWHMTALVAFVGLYQAAGFTLSSEPTAAWWLTRPVWLAGPGVLLAVLVAGLARFEGLRR
jgi:acyltransferase-like protein